MDASVELIDPDTRMVMLRTAVGTFPAQWMNAHEPEIGEISCELSTGPTCVWGVDVTDASPAEPDSIFWDGDGWMFVGTVLGVDPSGSFYAKGARQMAAHDLETGIFILDIGGITSPLLAADGLPADAAGRRVRVRQTVVEVY